MVEPHYKCAEIHVERPGRMRNLNTKSVHRLKILLIVMSLSLCLRDFVIPIADAFLPTTELKIEKIDSTNNNPVRIYNEGKQYDVFSLLQEAVSQNEDNGWEYVEGEKGVSWTRIVSSQANAAFTVKIRINPDYFFTCNKSRWCGAFSYSVGEGEPVIVDCYDEDSDGELLYVYPFQDNGTRAKLQVIVHIVFVIILYFIFRLLSIWHSKGITEDKRTKHQKERIKQLDFVRGIAMLLVIAGHCGIPEPYWTTIYSFHMPLFFMITGCCHGIGKKSLVPEEYSISKRISQEIKFILKNAKKCLLPYLLFSILGMLLSFVFSSIFGIERNVSQLNIWAHGILFGMGHVSYTGNWGAVWFLMAEFWLLLFVHYIEKTDKPTIIIACVVCPIIAVYFIAKQTIFGLSNPFNIGATLMGVPMYYVGYGYIKYFHKKIRFDANGVIQSLMLIGCGILLARQNSIRVVSFSGNSYGQLSYMIPGAIMTALGIIEMTDIWYSIHNSQHGILSRTIEAIGRNSITFLGLHGMLIVFVRHFYRELNLLENWLTVSIGVLIINGIIVQIYKSVRICMTKWIKQTS